MTYEQAIKIAADSIETLRRSDIFRVLEQNDNRNGLASYISAKRPEFADEVAAIMEEEFTSNNMR